MTYKVTIALKPRGNGPAMEQVIRGVSRIEQTHTAIRGAKIEVLNVYAKNGLPSIWGIGSILNISMSPELKKNACLNINTVSVPKRGNA
jgi:hypothetical protein